MSKYFISSSLKNSDILSNPEKSSIQNSKSKIKSVIKNMESSNQEENLLLKINQNKKTDVSRSLDTNEVSILSDVSFNVVKIDKIRKDKFGNLISKTGKDHKVAFSNKLIEVVPVQNYKVLNKKNNFKSSNNQCCVMF